MYESLETSVAAFAAQTRDAFLWPAVQLLAKTEATLPALLNLAGLDADDPVAILVTAAVIWALAGICISFALRLIRRALRLVVALSHLIVFRLDLALRNWKTKLVCTTRNLLLWRRASGEAEPERIEFDDLEIGILRYSVARGPGFAVSAPELAEAFALRPAQVQRGIDTLVRNRMLDYALGSTEGYDNYSLTDSGAAFLALWDRQQPDTLPAFS